MNVGERIKQKRIELNMSQDELAKKVGYKSRSSIQKIESSRDLPLRKVSKMAHALGCSEAHLMGWEELQDVLIDSYKHRDYMQSLTDEELSAIQHFRELNIDPQQVIKAIDFYNRLMKIPPDKRSALLTLLEVPQTDV